MACVSTYLSSISTSCTSNLPSIKQLWIGQFESANFTYTYLEQTDADGNQIIEAVSGATLNKDAKPWVTFNFKRNTGELTSEYTLNENGSFYFQNSISVVFCKIDNSKRLSLEAVASGECSCIVLDSNGQYWLLGDSNPVSMSSLSATTGVAISDSNAYNVSISEISRSMPILIQKEQAETIISTLTTVTPGA